MVNVEHHHCQRFGNSVFLPLIPRVLAELRSVHDLKHPIIHFHCPATRRQAGQRVFHPAIKLFAQLPDFLALAPDVEKSDRNQNKRQSKANLKEQRLSQQFHLSPPFYP
jgi:hypothetical protein